jgi:hypothetical protein
MFTGWAMNKVKAPLLIALAMVLATSACLVTLPAPAAVPATPPPNLVMTGKAQTLTAAPLATFTGSPVPPANTPTITLTPFPSITPLPTATSTPTETPIGFVASATPVSPTTTIIPTAETPDPAEGATDDWGSDYRCSIISKSPPNWTEVKGSYKVTWTLLNSGHKTWQADEIHLTYVYGAKVVRGRDKVFALPKDVKPGQSVTVYVIIYPPKEPGRYRSIWGLHSSRTNHVFCTFTAKTVVVQGTP